MARLVSGRRGQGRGRDGGKKTVLWKGHIYFATRVYGGECI